MTEKLPFEALSVETLAARLGGNEALCAKIGKDTGAWKVREVGDGNLNLVFIVEGASGAAVVKQALPYVRLVGDSWPLPLKRSFLFSDPYFDAKMNRHTSPQLDGLVADLRADRDLKVEAQRLKHIFAANAETLLHGDLHSGSIMVTDSETRMIDPEFAFYG
ncbi:MAG: S-methyl-5-thioribose kinase, partial [Mesorhizobium sp.]